MALVGIAYEAVVVIASAFIAAAAAYLAFRDPKIALWAYVAAFIPRAVIVVVALTGATNLGMLTWLSHSAGIFIYPMLLATGNILLIELSMAKIGKRKSSLPIDVGHAMRIDGFLARLQNRRLLPNYAEVKQVYLAGVLAGVINTVIVIAFGLI